MSENSSVRNLSSCEEDSLNLSSCMHPGSDAYRYLAPKVLKLEKMFMFSDTQCAGP